MSSAASASAGLHPVDEVLPTGRLAALGIQHVLVMYAGAVAVPLIVGRALKLSPQQVSMLISADLFCCGLVTLIQSWGLTQWFGIRLPVMMGVTFASVAPMLAIAETAQGTTGAQLIFGSIIGAGIVGTLIAPLVSRMLRYFPPVVTGSIIAIIGISLMRVGINWIFGNPFGPRPPKLVSPEQTEVAGRRRVDGQCHDHPGGRHDAARRRRAPGAEGPVAGRNRLQPEVRTALGIGVSSVVLISILLIAKYGKGFLKNISVLLGIVIGAVVAAALGMMSFDNVGKAAWFDFVGPFQFGIPIFDPMLILTMSLVMLVVMIESTGMFLALGDMTGKTITQPDLSRGLRTDGIGTLIGGIFNTFPYTSFSQNVGLVGVTGIKSRFVCVAAGLDPGRHGPAAQVGRAGRSAAHRRAGRRRAGDVRHGHGHRHSHPCERRFQDQPQQQFRRRRVDRAGNDSPDCAELQAVDAPRAAPADRIRHPADVDFRGRAEPVLQRLRRSPLRKHRCGEARGGVKKRQDPGVDPRGRDAAFRPTPARGRRQGQQPSAAGARLTPRRRIAA